MHSGHIGLPAKAILKHGSLDTGEKHPREGLVVVDAVLPTHVKDSSKFLLLETLQTIDVPTIKDPLLVSVWMGRLDHDLGENDFGSYSEVMHAEKRFRETSLRFVPDMKVISQVTLIERVVPR